MSDSPVVAFWVLLSLLTADPATQMKVIFPDVDGSNFENHRLKTAPYSYFAGSLQELHLYWLDAFAPNIFEAKILVDCLFNPPIISGSELGVYCYDEFVHGSYWGKLRMLAKNALTESGLPLHPLPDSINFREFIEIW